MSDNAAYPLTEHICGVCFMPAALHDPYDDDGVFNLTPACCHGCGCGEERKADDDDA